MLTHVYQIVRDRAARSPSSPAVGSQSGLAWRTLTSRELLDLVDHTACELAERGIRQGDRVVVWVPNQWRTPVFLFALWKLGAIVVPFDREMNPSAGAAIIRSIEPRCIIAGHGERPAWASTDMLTEWWSPLPESHRPGTPDGRAKFT